MQLTKSRQRDRIVCSTIYAEQPEGIGQVVEGSNAGSGLGYSPGRQLRLWACSVSFEVQRSFGKHCGAANVALR